MRGEFATVPGSANHFFDRVTRSGLFAADHSGEDSFGQTRDVSRINTRLERRLVRRRLWPAEAEGVQPRFDFIHIEHQHRAIHSAYGDEVAIGIKLPGEIR